MNIKKHIPNSITLINLFCGCVALVFLTKDNFQTAFYWVCLGIFFDFFDGFFARKFNVAGPLGVQLDSLADMVTSGVVPGYMMYKLLSNPNVFGDTYWAYFGFVITLGACYRLANFNIDTRQSDSFIGLPTPANCLFFMGLPFMLDAFENKTLSEMFYNPYLLIGLCLLSAFVMNAELPLFSLKIKNFSVKKYKLQLFFVLSCLALILWLRLGATPVIILFYVILSVVNNLVSKKQHG